MDYLFSKDREQQAAAFYLRYEVFVLEQGISPTAEFDQLDTSERFYFVAYQDQQPTGTIRYQAKNATTIQPDRLCVKKEFRQQGVGQLLLQQLEAQALAEGYQQSVLSAEISAIAFYQKQGYRITSPEYLEDGVPCVEMTKSFN